MIVYLFRETMLRFWSDTVLRVSNVLDVLFFVVLIVFFFRYIFPPPYSLSAATRECNKNKNRTLRPWKYVMNVQSQQQLSPTG